jgi:ribose transport system permease protein
MTTAAATETFSATPSRSALLRAGLVPLLLVLIVVAISLIEPRFTSSGNLLNIVRTAALLAIVACGQSLVLIVGGFDLSVGAVMGLVSVVAAMTMVALAPAIPGGEAAAIGIGILAALGCAAVIGFVNGALVAYLALPGFIVTLGMMSVVSGAVLLLTNGAAVYGMPKALISEFGRATWLSLPPMVYIAVVLIAGLCFMQRRTLLGRYIYAIGGNANAARMSGIPDKPYVIAAYVLSSILAGIAAVLLTTQIGSGQPSLGGERMMLQSIAAAVIGGVSLRGGIGRAEGVVLGAVFFTVLTNALNLIRVDSKLQLVFVGLVMVAAAALDEYAHARSRKS